MTYKPYKNEKKKRIITDGPEKRRFGNKIVCDRG